MRLGSFCTGYGGLDMAVEAHYGAHLAWCSEVDKDCNQVLAHHWPGVPNLGDLTKVDWDQVEPEVDIICAGFPCQPFSIAGKRQGADDERAIFEYIADGISVLRPGLVVLENVAGLLTLGGPRVVATLTGLGYDLRWGLVRASDAGAPHRRARWFCIATSRDADTSRSGLLRTPESKDDDTDQRRGRRHDSDNLGEGRGSRAAADADGAGSEAWGDARRASQLEAGVEPVGSAAPAAHASGVGRCAGSRLGEGQPSQQRGDGSGDDGDTTAAYTGGERHGGRQDDRGVGLLDGRDESQTRQQQRAWPEPVDRGAASVADATGTERRGEEHETVVAPAGSAPKPGERHSSYAWGDYADAINRWEWAIGRAAPKPVTDGKLSSRFVEWMMGLPDGWVTGVGLSRSQELKILGNGVIPHQAAAAYGWLLEQ